MVRTACWPTHYEGEWGGVGEGVMLMKRNPQIGVITLKSFSLAAAATTNSADAWCFPNFLGVSMTCEEDLIS